MSAHSALLTSKSYELWYHTHATQIESTHTLACPLCNFRYTGDDIIVVMPCLRCFHMHLQPRPTQVTTPF